MKQSVSLITLVARDIKKLARFYESLGWERFEDAEGMVTFGMIGQTLGINSLEALAKETGVPEEKYGRWAKALTHNVPTKEDVAGVLRRVEAAWAKVLKVAQNVIWGGHFGCFSDLEGHIWEVMWNQHLPLAPKGELQWKSVE